VDLDGYRHGAGGHPLKQLVSGDYVGQWVCERTGGIWSPIDAFALGWMRDEKLVAGVIFDHYNHVSVAMHVAGEGKWFDKDFARKCFDYAFNVLKVRKILGFVPEGNRKARRFDEHIGFKEETRVADATRDGDLIIYSMTRHDCRWLDGL